MVTEINSIMDEHNSIKISWNLVQVSIAYLYIQMLSFFLSGTLSFQCSHWRQKVNEGTGYLVVNKTFLPFNDFPSYFGHFFLDLGNINDYFP